MENFSTFLDNPDERKKNIYVFICLDSKIRKKIYDYLDINHENVFLSSTCVKFFPKEECTTLYCWECMEYSVKNAQYCEGIMDNNIDEWYRGNCVKCGERQFYEPNLDSSHRPYHYTKSNAILMSDLFHTYDKRKYTVDLPLLTKEEFEKIIDSLKFFKIKLSTSSNKKSYIHTHVNETINKLLEYKL